MSEEFESGALDPTAAEPGTTATAVYMKAWTRQSPLTRRRFRSERAGIEQASEREMGRRASAMPSM